MIKCDEDYYSGIDGCVYIHFFNFVISYVYLFICVPFKHMDARLYYIGGTYGYVYLQSSTKKDNDRIVVR